MFWCKLMRCIIVKMWWGEIWRVWNLIFDWKHTFCCGAIFMWQITWQMPLCHYPQNVYALFFWLTVFSFCYRWKANSIYQKFRNSLDSIPSIPKMNEYSENEEIHCLHEFFSSRLRLSCPSKVQKDFVMKLHGIN